MKTLQMIFSTDFGKSYVFNLTNPKENLSQAEVMNTMQSIIDGRYFETSNGRPVAVKEAKVVERMETSIFKNE